MATKKELVEALQAHVEKLEATKKELETKGNSPKHSERVDARFYLAQAWATLDEINALKAILANA